MKGVPLRIEIGPRDVAQNTVVLARRDMPGKAGKSFGVSLDDIAGRVRLMLDDIQDALLQRAVEFRDAHIQDISSYEELKAVIQAGDWARGWWAGSTEDELAVKDETGATIRCFPFDQPDEPGTCLLTGKPSREQAIFARAY
jgi:prolyl-tRNA synthetase